MAAGRLAPMFSGFLLWGSIRPFESKRMPTAPAIAVFRYAYSNDDMVRVELTTYSRRPLSLNLTPDRNLRTATIRRKRTISTSG